MVDFTNRMSREEINKRLHKFNLTNDWSVFDDVPELDQVSIMYPHVLMFGLTEEQYKQKLIDLFGPLTD